MRSLKTLYIELPMISELSDADLMQLRKCHTLQHLEIKREASTVRNLIIQDLASVIYLHLQFHLNWKAFVFPASHLLLTLLSERAQFSENIPKLCSCDISDDACVVSRSLPSVTALCSRNI